jgi:hypothetical protein
MPDRGADVKQAVQRFSERELGGGRFQGAGQPGLPTARGADS